MALFLGDAFVFGITNKLEILGKRVSEMQFYEVFENRYRETRICQSITVSEVCNVYSMNKDRI